VKHYIRCAAWPVVRYCGKAGNRTAVVRGKVASVDLNAQQVHLTADPRTGIVHSLPNDHLVLALGAVSNYLGFVGSCWGDECNDHTALMKFSNHPLLAALDGTLRGETEPLTRWWCLV
jgi:NADH dehydrogenase FAD-containing subunit